ncbi:CBO0543 family protein [Litchfieldia salsa]|nr:CBO0543 family protein [Litchfieldia salsa]
MHILLSIIMIAILWKSGLWRDWQKYHTVMLYFVMGNLLYNFLTANYFLWRLDADFISNHTLTEMLYTFIIFPITTLLFMGNYPVGKRKILLHYLWYISWYVFVEWIFSKAGYIEYQYGWNILWSAFFDCFMFPMLRLFYKKPIIAYLISIVIGAFFLWWFKVPVHIPVEERGK